MKKQIAKKFIYDGLGFPIILRNVPVRKIRGIVVPDINYNILQKCALEALTLSSSPLTGNQVRFIRQYLGMTLNAFAERFGVTHPAVMKWERAKNKYAKITPSTELYIRLSTLQFLKVNNEKFRNTFTVFDRNEKLKHLDSFSNTESKPLSLESASICA